MDIDARKFELRAQARENRDALASGIGMAAATGVAARFMSSPLSNLVRDRVVAGYMPMRSELDPQVLMRHLAGTGTVLCLPDVLADAAPLAFRRWSPDDALTTGRFDIAVPMPEADTLVPDVLLVPMLAFDRQGHRLGYGGGYYDRTIAELRARGDALAVGLAFSGQVRDDLPFEVHDIRLDWIVTETAAQPVMAAVG